MGGGARKAPLNGCFFDGVCRWVIPQMPLPERNQKRTRTNSKSFHYFEFLLADSLTEDPSAYGRPGTTPYDESRTIPGTPSDVERETNICSLSAPLSRLNFNPQKIVNILLVSCGSSKLSRYANERSRERKELFSRSVQHRSFSDTRLSGAERENK